MVSMCVTIPFHVFIQKIFILTIFPKFLPMVSLTAHNIYYFLTIYPNSVTAVS